MKGPRRNRPVVFGETLFDCFPDGSVVLGGAPLNVAWHLHAFGQEPLFITRVGGDDLGRRAREAFQAWGMDVSGVQVDPSHATGTVEVSLAGGEPRYDIVAERAYDFIATEELPSPIDASLLYHGSLALRGAVSRRTFRELSVTLAVPRFMDVNLRPPWWRREDVLDLVQDTRWLKLNEDELAALDPDGVPEGGRRLLERRGLGTLILTRGAQGAVLLSGDGKLGVAPAPVERVVDAVGAGDAFTSVFLLGLLEDWPPRTALTRAQEFASALLGVRGATIADAGFYAPFASRWCGDGARAERPDAQRQPRRG